jgi:hypothetical protein
MADRWEQPWDKDKLRLLKMYQDSGYFHPYTCPNDRSTLSLTPFGWVCIFCDYEQDWAWAVDEGLMEWGISLWKEWKNGK